MENKKGDYKNLKGQLNGKASGIKKTSDLAIDVETIELAKKGDKKAFMEIATSYDRIIGYISNGYYLIGGEKDDLMQEGYIGLWSAINDYDESKNCSFRHFAEKCIKRKILTAIRASTRKKHGPLNYYQSYNMPVYDNSDCTLLDRLEDQRVMDPLEAYIYKEEIEELNENIESDLSKLEQDVYKLHLAGMSYFEISDILIVAEKSVDNALQRAKKKISKKTKFEMLKI